MGRKAAVHQPKTITLATAPMWMVRSFVNARTRPKIVAMQPPQVPERRLVELRAGSLMTQAFRDLVRPPFSLILLLDLLIYGASARVSQIDDAVLFGALLLAVVSAYLQIATIMAASSTRELSADEWIKAAFRHRVFWRFALTGLLAITVILLGFLALIVGGLVIGSMLALAQPASVQERAWPFQAMRSSVALSAGNRFPIGIVFALLFIVPLAVLQTGAQLRWDRDLGAAWIAIGAVGTVAGLVGVIALTQAYVALGGARSERGSMDE
jgi:hypothetical protein